MVSASSLPRRVLYAVFFLSGASALVFELTEDAYQRRERLLPEDRQTIPLRDDRDAKTPQGLADTVTAEMTEDMKRLGIAEDTHYYRASERHETGEVDRTYEVGEVGEVGRRRRGSRAPRRRS